MKVLHVITRLVRGGAQQNTLMCAADQVARGHEVTVVAGRETGPEGSLWTEARKLPIHLVELPDLVREVSPSRDLACLVSLYRLMRLGDFQVVHTHTSKAGILGRWAAWAAGVPIVLHTPHGHVFYGYFSALKTRCFVWVERVTARLTDRLIMLTQGCRDDHLRAGVGHSSQLVVIPSGVDIEAFQACTAALDGLPPGRPRVGCVARLVSVKGLPDLLQAFALVTQQLPHAQLIIAGEGPLRDDLEALIEQLHLKGNVCLLGDTQDVAGVLLGLDLFVLASHNEGMGRAVVEAMACGLAVVATRVGGLPDLVRPGKTGLLVSPRAPTALAEAMLELLQNPALRREMGERGRQASQNWSCPVMFEKLDGLLEELKVLKGVA